MVKRGTVSGQLVAVRDTDDDASLQVRDWTICLITDPSLLPNDGRDGDKGEEGPEGKQGPQGKAGADGKDGAAGRNGVDGKSINFLGEWSPRLSYQPLDMVTLDGQTYIATEASRRKMPDDNPRQWALAAAKGERGERGERGIGQRGPGSGRLNLLQEQVDALLEGNTDLPEATAEVSIQRGEVVYVRADNSNLDLAKADALETSVPVGISVDTVSAGQTCRYVTNGPVTFDGWSLEPGRVYFLDFDVAGGLTRTEATDVGDFVIIIGTALTETMLNVEIHRAYKIGE